VVGRIYQPIVARLQPFRLALIVAYVNILIGLALTDPEVNAALSEIAWTPSRVVEAGAGAFGLLRVHATIWEDADPNAAPSRITARVWPEAAPILSTIDFGNPADRGSWEWLLMPNDAWHIPQVLGYEVVDTFGDGIELSVAYGELPIDWRDAIASFRSVGDLRDRLSRLARWPIRRECVDVLTSGDRPRWICKSRECRGTCVRIPIDTGSSVRLVCACS
jgi:hypothetical protein